jgi:hypothetical protein
MTSFADLCVAFSKHEERKVEFFQSLFSQVGEFQAGLHKYIDAPDELVEEGDGSKRPYVRLLRANDDGAISSFADMGPLDHELTVWFRIGVVLEREANGVSMQLYSTKVGLRWLADAMDVFLPEFDEAITCPRHESQADYTPAFDTIVTALKTKLEFDPFNPA